MKIEKLYFKKKETIKLLDKKLNYLLRVSIEVQVVWFFNLTKDILQDICLFLDVLTKDLKREKYLSNGMKLQMKNGCY